MSKIKVAIVDKDLAWIKLIIDLIHKEEDITVLWSATNSETAVSRAKDEDVDVILMSNELDGDGQKNISSIEEIAAIRKARIIVMTTSFNEALIKSSIHAGVSYCILKKVYTNIPVLIRLTYHQIFLPNEFILEEYDKIRHELALSELTPTEKELYLLKKQGYSIKQIVLKTHKSEGTVRNQLSRAYKKLIDKR